MIPIIPKWSAYGVKDWQELLVNTPNGDIKINGATAAIINYMAIVGTPELTSESLDDSWRRIAIHQAIFGSFVYDNDTGKPIFLTKSDIKRHIGLETEADKLSFQEFCAKIEKLKLDSDTDLSEKPSFIANENATMLELFGIY